MERGDRRIPRTSWNAQRTKHERKLNCVRRKTTANDGVDGEDEVRQLLWPRWRVDGGQVGVGGAQVQNNRRRPENFFVFRVHTQRERERERQSARHLHFFSFSFFFDRSMERGLEPVVYTVGRGAGFLRPTTGCRKTADGRHLAAASCEPLRPGVSSQMSAVISHDGGSTIVMWTLRHTEQKKTTQKKATTSPSFSFPPLWWTGGTRWK